MNDVWTFLSRTQGRDRLTVADWISYAYLLSGFLLIFIPVVWLTLNSVKSSFQIQKEDISLLPGDYQRVARLTYNGPEGKQIFIVAGLPEWVLNWQDLTDDEQKAHDVVAFLQTYDGPEFYVLRSHLGLVDAQARALIAAENLPEWLTRYSTMSEAAREGFDLDAILARLSPEDSRLISEFAGVAPFTGNRLTSQILVSAPHPETGLPMQWAVTNIDTRREFLAARAVGDPSGTVVRLPSESVRGERQIQLAWENYIEPLTGTSDGVNVNFARCFGNSVFVTVVGTLLTLLINSMAAFALSKYRFQGQIVFLAAVLATLMVPPTIQLVGVFKAIHATGLSGSLWGVIIPGAATPAGVFMLRQYMLTIPDELLEAARMDAASEWKLFWRIIIPLSLPAIAALGILSVVWRWNDLIVPLVAVSTVKDAYTIQLCLLEFRGENISQEHYRLAMTIVSLIPTTLVFVVLQKYITTGIANTGIK